MRSTVTFVRENLSVNNLANLKKHTTQGHLLATHSNSVCARLIGFFKFCQRDFAKSCNLTAQKKSKRKQRRRLVAQWIIPKTFCEARAQPIRVIPEHGHGTSINYKRVEGAGPDGT